MPAFENPLEPVARVGEAVRLEPANEVYEVVEVEQMGRVGPVDYGSANSGQSSTDNSGSTIQSIESELEMHDNHLGQFIVNPLSLIEVEIRQVGSQDQRFTNKANTGVITPYDPVNQRIVWVLESAGINAIFTNPQTWNMAKTLVYYTGFRYELSENELSDGEIRQLPGSPASVPIDDIGKKPAEGAGKQ